MTKLAIITTHPIQYYAPVFKLLSERKQVEVKVFYTWGESVANKYDPGFNKVITWDIPLLDGYPFEWVENTAIDAGSHNFKGIVTPGLNKQIEKWQPDAILVYGWGYQGHLKALRYFKKKVPVFFRGDSTLLDEKKGAKAMLKSLLLKWIYRHVDHAFFVGINNKNYFKKYGLKEQQLSFAPHAIDNKRFAADRINEAAIFRASLGLGDNELLIMFAAKLEEKKAPLLLLKAFNKLKADSIHLLFIGNGPMEQQLKSEANGLSRVHFMDFQNQSMMPVAYQACDLFCLPSGGPNETWGLAINEAMACGKPILTSNRVGAAADLVKPGKNGAIFEAGSLEDLVNNLDTLVLNGKQKLAEMGDYSKMIISDWTIEKQVVAIESMVGNISYKQ